MKTVYILVPECAVPAAIVDPQYLFTAVNRFYNQAHLPNFYNVKLVGLTSEVRVNTTVTFHTDFTINNAQQPDLIIVPAIFGDMEEALNLNRDFIDFITTCYRKGAEVASLCVGAFLLASTGLLNGKSCSTHWLFANEFKTRFPKVNLVADRVVSYQNGLYSSGGANAYWNLLLYLVEKFSGREMAIMAAKFFLLDIEKNSQLPFSVFKGQRLHNDDAIKTTQDFLEKNYDQKIMVEDLADQINLGRRTFERRFKKATGSTVVEYLQRIKMEAAKTILENDLNTVNEAMFAVGYNDPKSFREIFKKYAGLSPVDYKLKFQKKDHSYLGVT